MSPMQFEAATGIEIDTNDKLLRERLVKEFNRAKGISN